MASSKACRALGCGGRWLLLRGISSLDVYGMREGSSRGRSLFEARETKVFMRYVRIWFPAIRLDGRLDYFHVKKVKILRWLSCQIGAGEFCSLLGHNLKAKTFACCFRRHQEFPQATFHPRKVSPFLQVADQGERPRRHRG